MKFHCLKSIKNELVERRNKEIACNDELLVWDRIETEFNVSWFRFKIIQVDW